MLIRKVGEKAWSEPASQSYASEKDLENLLKESPEVIPGIPQGPAAVVTQLYVPDTGPADIVVIDAEGGITIIECKLKVNPEVRRWVIGQVFSYASGLALMGVEQLDQCWRSRSGGADIISSFTPALPEETLEAGLLARIGSNLAAGNLRLVIAVDAMTDELKRTVTYINGHATGLELLGLELKYISHGDVEILVPSVYGEESASRKAAPRTPGPTSGRGSLYQAFWTKYLERLHEAHPSWTTASVPSTANWMNMRSPIKGSVLANSFSTGGKLRHELYVDTGEKDSTERLYNFIRDRKEDLEKAYGGPLQWEPLPDKRACRVAEYTDGDVAQEHRYDEFIQFLLDAGERMRRALGEVQIPVVGPTETQSE